jgi:hypothetical protein
MDRDEMREILETIARESANPTARGECYQGALPA